MKTKIMLPSLVTVPCLAMLGVSVSSADDPVFFAQRIGTITNISGSLTNCNGDLYLSGYDTTYGFELRKLNATGTDLDLVSDLSPGTNGSVIDRITEVGTKVFFRATVNGSGVGNELYITDGTSGGTDLVKDVRSGSNSSSIDNLNALGDTLFFTANDGVHGNELWTSDGTESGTSLFKDFRPASADSSSSANQFTALSVGGVDYLYFSGNDGSSGAELWRTNGTLAGTTLVSDIYSGTNGSNIGEIANAGSGFYFKATDGTYGLFHYNGSGVSKVKTLNDATASGAPSNLAYIGSTLFFDGYQDGNGHEPWTSDGSETGTEMIKDLGGEFNGNSNPSQFTRALNGIVFQAGTSATGHELYTTDGSSSGTGLLKDINPGTGSSVSNSAAFTRVGDYVFFAANDGVNGNELWVTDGTAAGTYMALDMNPGSGNGFPIGTTYMVNLNGTLFFKAFDGTSTNLYKLITASTVMSTSMTSGELGHLNLRSSGGLGSDASLRIAAASSSFTCSLAFRERAGSEFSLMLSDVLDVSGTGSNPFLLQMAYSPDVHAALGSSSPMVAWNNGGTWVNAILGNTGMSGLSSSAIAALFTEGPYTEGLPVGSWGHDATNHIVWAVIDHNSEFAATPATPSAAYASWIDTYYPGITDAATVAVDADPDDDGIPNSVEYVLGTSPSSATQSSLPTLVKTTDTAIFQFVRSKAAGEAGFSSSVEYTTDLSAGSWSTASPSMTAIAEDGSWETINVTLPATGSKLFARLRVTSL